jgi:3-oxoacyl-[acyl-carrier-protein] synthase II
MGNRRRVVVTGLGMITPYGVGVEAFWAGMLQGKSAISKIEGMNLEGQSVLIAGEIKGFEEMGLIDPKEAKHLDRYNQLALIALDEAMKSAGLKENSFEDPYRVGVIVGSGVGGFDTFEKQHHIIIERGPTKCTPYTIPMIINDMAAGRISIKIGAKGINKAVISACATSNHCIGDSFRSIQWGEADIMIAGGAESVITPLGIGAFTSLRTLSKRNDEPERASRPFDKDRDGFVMSEGSGILVLEELEHAKKRGATIYAEIVGYGQSADAYHIVAPDPEGRGSMKAMEFALKDAGIEPEDIGYINMHGTSTGLGDIAESQAIAKIFGDKETNKKLKVSSTKSMHGHLLGATGACEAIVCIKAMEEGKIPPTINLDNQDPEVANLDYVPNKSIDAELNITLSNSFGFGGHNTSLVFKKYKG